MMQFSLILMLASLSSAALPERLPAAGGVAPAATGPQEGNLGVYAHVSARVLNELVQREIERKENVFESILNMNTRGTALVNCRVTLELIPNAQVAHIRFHMSGQAVMNNMVGTVRSVQVYSASQTRITGHKDVLIDDSGVKLLPARAVGRTSVQVNNVEARSSLVERLARRRVDRAQPQAEGIAAQRAARRAEQQLEAEINEPLGQVHEKYLEHVRQPLVRKEAFPDVRMATTSEHLTIKLLTRTPIAGSRPAPTPAHDVSVSFRDQFINDSAYLALGGKTFADRQFANWMQTLTGTTPRALWVHERGEPWTITMAERNPLAVSFEADQIRVALNLGRATRAGATLEQPLTIRVAYTPQITRDGPLLVRLGEVALEFTDPADERADDPAQTGFRQFLRRKFAGVFPAELYFDGLMPPAGGLWARLRSLNLTQFTSRDGWLALGYEWSPAASVTGTKR